MIICIRVTCGHYFFGFENDHVAFWTRVVLPHISRETLTRNLVNLDFVKIIIQKILRNELIEF